MANKEINIRIKTTVDSPLPENQEKPLSFIPKDIVFVIRQGLGMVACSALEDLGCEVVEITKNDLTPECKARLITRTAE